MNFRLSFTSAVANSARERAAAMEHSPHCSTALCCRRHPRACKAVSAVSKNTENCRGELYSPHTAILSAASPDAVTQQRWHAFSCLFAGAGDLYVASSSNPCASCSFEFVQISRGKMSKRGANILLLACATLPFHLQIASLLPLCAGRHAMACRSACLPAIGLCVF